MNIGYFLPDIPTRSVPQRRSPGRSASSKMMCEHRFMMDGPRAGLFYDMGHRHHEFYFWYPRDRNYGCVFFFNLEWVFIYLFYKDIKRNSMSWVQWTVSVNVLIHSLTVTLRPAQDRRKTAWDFYINVV